MDSVTINIDYDEFQPGSYRAVCVGDRRFGSGDVVKDFKQALKYASAHYDYVGLSSSCDHFTQDNKAYGWATDPELGEYIIVVDALKIWAMSNVLDAASAANLTGLSATTIRGAINRGELPAWKPDGSRVWLMLREDVETWRKSRRNYERKD